MWTLLGLDSDLAREAIDWSLKWHSSWPLWVVLLVVAACVTYVWQIYRRESTKLVRRDMIIFTALRIVAVLVLLIMMFEPFIEWTLPTQKDASLVVLFGSNMITPRFCPSVPRPLGQRF